MDVVYKNTEKYNPNKNLNPIVIKLVIIGRKLNISLIFIVQSYFAIPKYIRLISTNYFIMKIAKKQELRQFAGYWL